MSWHYTLGKIQQIAKDLSAAVTRESAPFGEVRYTVGDFPGREPAAPGFDDSTWTLLPDNRAWGTQPEITAWLRTSFTVPADWKRGRIVAHVRNVDCETLTYVNGTPISSFDGGHRDVIVADKAAPGKTHVLALEAYSGLGQKSHPNPYFGSEVAYEHRLAEAEFRLIDPDIYDYYYDVQFALDAIKTLDTNTREYAAALAILDKSVTLLDFRQGVKSDIFLESVAAASKLLRDELYGKLTAGDMAPVAWATGHAHIDTAWLWRLAHTRKKCERTFTTQLELAKRYPEYRFTCSQPQQYQYVKEDNPELYERIKESVKAGNWIPLGGMWVESDCNVVSGESLVRQFLYGIRFTEKELGFRSNVVWLPDVFGYSAAFPQIIKKAGMKYFMTIKIFWNQINRPPYQTFDWVGIDGTSVLTHFSPLGDYNAVMTPEQLQKNWKGYDQKHISDSNLYIYGFGDGGGGVTPEMLEYAERAKDFVGVPKVKHCSPEDFFDNLDTQVRGNRELPVWRGELYLEYHRGTYTSQAANKLANRRSEYLLQAAEQASAMAHALTGASYPGDEIVDAWKIVLLNQFHDIIPGSSIGEVYVDSAADYARVAAIGAAAMSSALGAIAGSVSAPAGSVIAFNPLSWSREDVAEAPASLGLAGQSVTTLDGEAATLVDLRDALPSVGYAVLSGASTSSSGSLTATEKGLENQFFTVKLDKNGEIESILDKRNGREVIDPAGTTKGNAFLTFEDKPMAHEAWDIDIYYQDKVYPVQSVTSIKVVEKGPIRASVEIERTVGEGRGSTIRQRISLYANLPRIDFVTDVDWHERQTLLKVAFPVTVNAMQATYDIQFGNLERPTHWNTSWDWARFEVCGHKWADLSEGDYGVALFSDCKYGWDIRDNVMRLTLIKSAVSPDPEADQGKHRFAYSLFPHEGGWRAANVIQRAFEFNVPVKFASATGGGTLPASLSLVSVDKPNIIVETVKKAEDSDALIIRVHDEYNQRGTATLSFPRDIAIAKSVNLLEEDSDEAAPTVIGNKLTFAYGPFEIRTFSVTLK
ncbi:MAG TPA: alpha-mannosidase [Capsulimonadaceae bacterium]|jgi:alpha-mannosidase